MAIFYTRQETEKETIITYRYLPLYYLCLAVLLVSIFIFKNPYVFLLILIFLLIYLIDTIKPNLEIRKAMKIGAVKLSGQKLSFSNPLKVVIKK